LLLRALRNLHPSLPGQLTSELIIDIFKIKLDKLAQIIKAVEVAKRSKYEGNGDQGNSGQGNSGHWVSGRKRLTN